MWIPQDPIFKVEIPTIDGKIKLEYSGTYLNISTSKYRDSVTVSLDENQIETLLQQINLFLSGSNDCI